MVGRVVSEPELAATAQGEVWGVRLAVARRPNDVAVWLFLDDVLLCGWPTQDVKGRLAAGGQLRVSGALDVGLCQTVDGGRRWSLQLAAHEIARDEIDLANACAPSDSRLLEGTVRRR